MSGMAKIFWTILGSACGCKAPHVIAAELGGSRGYAAPSSWTDRPSWHACTRACACMWHVHECARRVHTPVLKIEGPAVLWGALFLATFLAPFLAAFFAPFFAGGGASFLPNCAAGHTACSGCVRWHGEFVPCVLAYGERCGASV